MVSDGQLMLVAESLPGRDWYQIGIQCLNLPGYLLDKCDTTRLSAFQWKHKLLRVYVQKQASSYSVGSFKQVLKKAVGDNVIPACVLVPVESIDEKRKFHEFDLVTKIYV